MCGLKWRTRLKKDARERVAVAGGATLSCALIKITEPSI